MTARGRLLLTGVTGFLGGALAARLLQSPRWRELLIMVRAPDAAQGKARIAECMSRFAVDPAFVERLGPDQILCGDLCEVERYAHDHRLRDVSDVVNCAAFASFSNHPGIFKTNVEGTVAFGQAVAGQAKLRRFIQVGTAMCCGADAPRLVLEGYEPSPDALQLVPYTASKLQGERELAKIDGLRLVVARPSIIVGHTQLGCRPSPSIFWVFRMARALRGFPCPAEARIDIVPVDWCADAILHLLDAEHLSHASYQLSAGAGASCSFRDIDEAISRGLGEPPTQGYRAMSYEEIKERQHEFDALFGPCIGPVMLRAIKLYGDFASLDILFDNHRLLDEGMREPPPFTAYAGLCALSTRGAPIAGQMQYDFKGMPTRRRPAQDSAQPILSA